MEVLFTVVSAAFAHPFHHLQLSGVFQRICWPSCDPVYATNTSQRKQETYLYDTFFATSPFVHRKTHNGRLLFGNTHLNQGRHFYKPASEHAHARPLPKLSWNRTVLLPSDKYRKPITSITAVLLPFVT
jgi:hypothetical protein